MANKPPELTKEMLRQIVRELMGDEAAQEEVDKHAESMWATHMRNLAAKQEEE